MGNCLKLKPVRTWADDDEDWEFVNSENMEQCKEKDDEKTVKTGRKTVKKIEISSDQAKAKVVKIKITKKQLNELLQSVEMHDLLPDMTRRDDEYDSRLVPWRRPVLQSIPEAEEC